MSEGLKECFLSLIYNSWIIIEIALKKGKIYNNKMNIRNF